MKTVPIERRSRVAPADFRRGHLEGGGRPLIVTDAMDGWGAHDWTFANLGARFGADLVPVSLGLASPVAKMTKVSAFMRHLERPGFDLPGFWVDLATGKPLAREPRVGGAAYYLMGWLAFQKHPELFGDIQPAPYFVDDWELALSPRLREAFQRVSGRETTSLYVGAKGALSKLHRDYWNTHAYLAQVAGTKQVMLFSPKDTGSLYEGEVDPERPDFEAFPKLRDATAHTAVIGPGDMLFMPAGWWHWVRSLENSITVSHNFFNQSNFDDHLAGLLGDLPRLAESLAIGSAAKLPR